MLAERLALRAAPRSSWSPVSHLCVGPTFPCGDLWMLGVCSRRCHSCSSKSSSCSWCLTTRLALGPDGLTAETSWPSQWRVGSTSACLRKSRLVQPSASGDDTAPCQHWVRQCDVVSIDREHSAAILVRGPEQADALQVRGWWSAHARAAKWCFDHMLRGCRATRRHDGGPCHASVRWRATRGGWSLPPAISWGLAFGCRGRLDQ